MNSLENQPEKEDEFVCLEGQIETLRKITFWALCFAFISLLTAVFFIPIIITNARNAQAGIDRESSICLGKLSQLYNRIDRIEPQIGKGNGRRRSRHVSFNTKNKLQHAIKIQRKSRYLQQKLAETAALLNSREVWENQEEMGGIKKSKDDTKNNAAELIADNGAEINEEGNKAEELFGSSSSFEISSEQNWLNQKINGFIIDFTTTFPLPPISRISPRIHNSKESSPPHPHSLTTIASPFFLWEKGGKYLFRVLSEKDDQKYCVSIYGPPGLPGPPGVDGHPGRDGRPGQNGMNGRDAPKDHISSIDDFCFKCPRGMAGEPGPRGPKGPPGKAGNPGEDGEPGRKGMPGRRGRTGMRGKVGKPGLIGKQGQHGRVTIIPGPDGPEGKQGRPGLAGSAGAPGRSGYSECGRPGPIGSPGIDGKNGAVGAPGNPGAPGKPGVPGGCGHCNVPRTAPGY